MLLSRIKYLLQQYASPDGLGAAETSELSAVLQSADANPEVLLALQEILESAPDDERIRLQNWQPLIEKIVAIDQSITTQAPVHRTYFLRMAWFRYAAAIILIAGISISYFIITKPRTPEISKIQQVPVQTIMPGGNKAILTLANGKTIILDSSNLNLEGRRTASSQLIAKDLSAFLQGSQTTSYNTLSTPKGGQYQAVLSDGTKVWLNAASSIKFPTAFTDKERVVEITGESYLEVAADKTKPFLVSLRQAEGKETTIQVLGTSFNVNAYSDEAAMKTTLVEGSIKIENHLLKPGEAYSAGKIVQADISQDVAWKSGVFNFNKLSLPAVMKQLSRWYGIEVVYGNNLPPITFYGKMGRDLTLNQVLNGLSGLGVSYTIEKENKLIITRTLH